MSKFDKFIEKLPKILSSRVSVYIYLFLFFYLVMVGVAGLFFPKVEPSNTVQLIFGNYTNVLSALGASLAAGFGSKHLRSSRELHDKHDALKKSVDELHQKVDDLSRK